MEWGSVDIAAPVLVGQEAAKGPDAGANGSAAPGIAAERADRGTAGSTHQCPATGALTRGGAAQPARPRAIDTRVMMVLGIG